ncbi:hypothetical protein ACIGFK_37335 [Streptomyces sp. NPDC085524]
MAGTTQLPGPGGQAGPGTRLLGPLIAARAEPAPASDVHTGP